MKALGYTYAHSLQDFQIIEFEAVTPVLQPDDILVRVKAISFNPVDYKIRQTRLSQNSKLVVLGWDASGVVEQVGSNVKNFKNGDEVFYSGDLTRDGSYTELQAVDSRLVALKPKSLSFAEAASLPLTSLTAWEGLFERGIEYNEKSKVLIIGGAGGVGSIATQLLKACTQATVIATASREDTAKWCKEMGADIVINHKDLAYEFKGNNIDEVDVIYGTTHSADYLTVIPQLLRPFGHFILIDDPQELDIKPFKQKALNVHWEFMFAKSMFGYNIESQGKILAQVAELVDAGRVKPTINSVFKGLTAENVKQAHTTLERSNAIGKMVLEVA